MLPRMKTLTLKFIWAFAWLLIRKGIALLCRKMLDNIVVVEAANTLRVLDNQGHRVCAERRRKYAVRWFALDYLPIERITLGKTGKLTSLKVIEPEGLACEIIGGGLGQSECVFRVRAPRSTPTYGFRKTHNVDLIVQYEASDVYTRDDLVDAFCWTWRLPFGKPIPKTMHFKLDVPKGHPILAEPRTYFLRNLAHVESAYSDLILEKALEWERLPDPCNHSSLRASQDLTQVRWRIRPRAKNTAYKIEWDWWE